MLYLQTAWQELGNPSGEELAATKNKTYNLWIWISKDMFIGMYNNCYKYSSNDQKLYLNTCIAAGIK